MSHQPTSANFGFLAKHDRHLARLAGFAELYCSSDPNTALVKLRQFVERLAEFAAARHGATSGLDLRAQIDELYHRRLIGADVARALHTIRKQGNRAVHELSGTAGEALHALKSCRNLGIWYLRTFVKSDFKAGAFIAPRPPADVAAGLKRRLTAAQAELAELKDRAAGAHSRTISGGGFCR